MRGTFFAGLVAAAVLSCNDAGAQDRIKVAVGGRGIGETFVTEIGQNAGLFKKHGLELEILYTDGGGETMQAVIANSAPVGIAAGFLGVIGAYAKGAPVRIIGSSFSGGSQLYWYVPTSSPIRTPKDTEGKTVAYSTNGSSTHAAVLAFQKHFGVTFKPTATGSAQATRTQAMSGQVDVGWAGAPFAVDALEAGQIRVVMRASDPPELDKQTSRLIVANAGELAARPDVFARFLRGYRDSLDWIYATPEGRKAYAAFAGISEAVAARALKEFLPPAAVDPSRISGLDAVMADAVAFKYIAAPLTDAQLDDMIRIPGWRK